MTSASESSHTAASVLARHAAVLRRREATTAGDGVKGDLTAGVDAADEAKADAVAGAEADAEADAGCGMDDDDAEVAEAAEAAAEVGPAADDDE